MLNALSYTIMFFTILGIGEILVIPVMILSENIYDIDMFYSESITPIWVFTLVISRIITYILIKSLGKYWYKIEIIKTRTEKVLLYFPLLMAFFVAILMEHYLINIENFNIQDIISVLSIVSVLLMAFTLTHMKLFEKNIITQQQEKQITELQHRNETQYLFYEEKSKHENEIKRIRHDLKNHLLLIKDMQKKNSYDYYQGLLEIVSNDDSINSGCNVFDVLINEKRKQADHEKIVFDILLTKDISCINYIEERDLCSIFGNLIDNAIENTAKVENAKVMINVDVINSFFVMVISNTYENKKLRKDKNKFLTTKANKNIHGIGLQNVEMTIEKYEGHVRIDYDQFIFKVEIMIPLNNEKAK